MSEIDTAVAAIRRGELVVLPTDTVYGLACTAGSETAAADLYKLKGRDVIQPTAVIFAGLDVLLESLPELGDGGRRGCAHAPAGPVHARRPESRSNGSGG